MIKSGVAVVLMALLAAACGISEREQIPATSQPRAAQAAPSAPAVYLREAPAAAAEGPGEAPAYQSEAAAVHWSSYRDFWFGHDSERLDATDGSTVSDIANYVRQNPAYRVGIDGAQELGNMGLGERRAEAIRQALIKAGVRDDRIQIGAFGDPRFRRERRVEVLIATRN